MTARYEDVLGPLREAYDAGADWRNGMAAVRRVLRADGLFFVGVYSGTQSSEGPLDDDGHVPPRFFSWRTDEQLLGFAADAGFEVVDFHPVDTDRGFRFQSLTLRRPDSE
jgi:hypothetical protein